MQTVHGQDDPNYTSTMDFPKSQSPFSHSWGTDSGGTRRDLQQDGRVDVHGPRRVTSTAQRVTGGRSDEVRDRSTGNKASLVGKDGSSNCCRSCDARRHNGKDRWDEDTGGTLAKMKL